MKILYKSERLSKSPKITRQICRLDIQRIKDRLCFFVAQDGIEEKLSQTQFVKRTLEIPTSSGKSKHLQQRNRVPLSPPCCGKCTATMLYNLRIRTIYGRKERLIPSRTAPFCELGHNRDWYARPSTFRAK